MIYAEPRLSVNPADCFFYHTMDIPGHGLVNGLWDLRGREAEYLGRTDFAGQRVLEIGPASGYLTWYMESRGAEVVSIELDPSYVWELMPVDIKSGRQMENFKDAKTGSNDRLHNSFWLTHERHAMYSKLHYGHVQHLPDEIGEFDISTLCLVLTHMRDPIAAIEACARRTRKRMIITERFRVPKEVEDLPLMRLSVNDDHDRMDRWWWFSPGFFNGLLKKMGFSKVTIEEVVCGGNNGTTHIVQAITADW